MSEREIFTCEVVVINENSKPQKIVASYYKTPDYKLDIGFRAIITEVNNVDGEPYNYPPALEVNIEREIYLHSQKETPAPKPQSTVKLADILPDKDDDSGEFDESSVVILDAPSEVVEEPPKGFSGGVEGDSR